jgi:uncharacterized DUF497 family protein
MLNKLKFDYDPEKSKSNKDKHGIDFKEAQLLWDDEYRVRKELPYKGEKRIGMTGLIKEKLWTAIVTYRNAKIRIISVRHPHKDEKENYYE